MSKLLTFYGHSAFMLTTDAGLKIVVDPWLDNPLSPPRRESSPADVILVTHAHGDHMGNCIELAKASGAEVVAIHEIQQYLLGKGLTRVTGMNIGGTYVTSGVALTMVPAVHSSCIQDGDAIIYGGEAGGFVVKLEDGFSIYHAGDTALFGDMALIAELYRPRISILPIGSHYVMGPKEAAYACRLLQPETVVPMHYGTFPALTGTVEEFRKELSALSVDVKVLEMKPGESAEF